MGKRLDFEKETKRGIVRQRGYETVEPSDTTLTRRGFFRSDEGGSADQVYCGPEPTSGPRKARRSQKAANVQAAAGKGADIQTQGPTKPVSSPVKTAATSKKPIKGSQHRGKARISIKAPAPQPMGSDMPKVVQQSMPRGVARNVTVETKPIRPPARSRGGKK
jgi:hypothetical protein